MLFGSGKKSALHFLTHKVCLFFYGHSYIFLALGGPQRAELPQKQSKVSGGFDFTYAKEPQYITQAKFQRFTSSSYLDVMKRFYTKSVFERYCNDDICDLAAFALLSLVMPNNN